MNGFRKRRCPVTWPDGSGAGGATSGVRQGSARVSRRPTSVRPAPAPLTWPPCVLCRRAAAAPCRLAWSPVRGAPDGRTAEAACPAASYGADAPARHLHIPARHRPEPAIYHTATVEYVKLAQLHTKFVAKFTRRLFISVGIVNLARNTCPATCLCRTFFSVPPVFLIRAFCPL